jgi:hypothetical protein
VPSIVSPHVKFRPGERETNFSDPGILCGVGVAEIAEVGWPSWPTLFDPQQ